MMEKGELLQLHCAQALHCVHLPSPLHCASIDLGAGWPSHQSGGADQQYRILLGIKQALDLHLTEFHQGFWTAYTTNSIARYFAPTLCISNRCTLQNPLMNADVFS